MLAAAAPVVCPRCGGGPVVALHWDPIQLSASDRTEVAAGRAALAHSGRPRIVGARSGLPPWGCIGCVPDWGAVHQLAQQDYDWQEAKEAAILARDFEAAARLRDLQHGQRPRQAALVEPLLLCLAPDPLVRIDPQWRTDTVVLLARRMHDAGDFGAMPILADALQDAGCEDERVLAHCRDATLAHVRGCWVVASVLGEE